jgi:type VI secretion system protein ImpF
MAYTERLNPTLFDKLVADLDMPGLYEDGKLNELSRSTMQQYRVPRLDRFNENALRDTVKRDLAWLLNTSNMAAGVNLDPYPQVKTSVLNFGVNGLTGKALSVRALQQRAREIQNAIKAFEPRIGGRTLRVEPVESTLRENSITYVIHGDITTAANAIAVAFKTDVEADTSIVTVRD